MEIDGGRSDQIDVIPSDGGESKRITEGRAQ